MSRRLSIDAIIAAGQPALRVDRITTEAGLAALAPEWERLAAGLIPWTPFATPTWNLTHWRHFRRRSVALRDQLHAYAIRATGDGRLVAVAPMLLTLRPGIGPAALRALVFFGADPNVTEIRGLVCQPEDEAAATAALIERLQQERGAWDWLHWGTLRRDGAAHQDVMARMTPVTDRTIPVFYIELPDSFDALRARLSRNTKEALRKCYNSLKKAGHDFSFHIVTEPADVDPALDIFFRLHAERAEADYGVAHPNAFAWPQAQAFLRDYAKQSAARGELRIFQIKIAGEVAATRLGFCTGEDLYLYYSGHLPAYGRHSVMTTAVAEALKWAISAGVRRVHLSIGRDRSKLRWEPQEIALSEAYHAAPTWRGRLMLKLFLRRTPVPQHWGPPGRPEADLGDAAAD